MSEQLVSARDVLMLIEDDNPALRLCVGRRLGDVRRLQRVKQDKVANHLSMSRSHLSNIEQGRARTGWPGLRRMAEYLQLGFEELIEECSRTLAGEGPQQHHHHKGERRMYSGDKAIQTPAMITDQERLMLMMWSLLDDAERQWFVSEMFKRIQQNSQQIGSNDKKV